MCISLTQKLVIQWDGDYWHNLPKRRQLDESQDKYMKKCGYKVLRFWEHEVKGNSNKVKEVIGGAFCMKTYKIIIDGRELEIKQDIDGKFIIPDEFVQGRFPANVILDEETARMLDEPARFFYCAKAGRDERFAYCQDCDKVIPQKEWSKHKNHEVIFHPTVKPLKLMEYLVRLITPPDGVVLDPFFGTGTTGIACLRQGFKFIGIEIDELYCKIANFRLSQENLTNCSEK